MNLALIFAGGTGTRMNSKTKPKQFLELKPIQKYAVAYLPSGCFTHSFLPFYAHLANVVGNGANVVCGTNATLYTEFIVSK